MISGSTTVVVEPEGEEQSADSEATQVIDPRVLLADWANESDEWVRLLVSQVLVSGRPVGDSTVEKAYQLFRQEKALDERVLPVVPPLSIDARQDESAPPLTL